MQESDVLKLSDQLFLEITQRKFTHFRGFLVKNKIKCLSLENRKLNASSLCLLGEALAGITLQTLDLSNTQLEDETLVDFATQTLAKTRISFINFSFNLITNEGAKLFLSYAKNSKIIGVSFQFNDITHKGLLSLSPLLRRHPFHVLDFSGNNLQDEGAVLLIETLKGSLVRKAILCQNELSNEGISNLIEHLPQTALVSVDVRNNKEVSSEMLTILNNALLRNQIEHMRNGYHLWCAIQKAQRTRSWGAIVKKEKTPTSQQFLRGMAILKDLPKELQASIIQYIEPHFSLNVVNSYTNLFAQRKENAKMRPNLTSSKHHVPQKNPLKKRTPS